MNKIRKNMSEEAEAFIPVLRETYRLIQSYQQSRSDEDETCLRLQLMRATREMQKFKPLLQRKWQIYLEALEQPTQFQIGDLIYALDSAVHQMHLRAGNKGLTRENSKIDAQTPWSSQMKQFLNERRQTAEDGSRKTRI